MVTVGMIERALNAFRPDLVHIATEGPLGWATLRAAKRLGLPVVSSYHTNFPQYLQTYNASFLEPFCWKYLRWFHNNTLATFCPSDSTRELIEAKGFKNVDIWSRGVDNHRFHRASGTVACAIQSASALGTYCSAMPDGLPTKRTSKCCSMHGGSLPIMKTVICF